MNRTQLSRIGSAIFALCLCVVAHAEAVDLLSLVIDRKPLATIVTAAEPTRSVQNAVTEFNYFLMRITGTTLPVATDTQPVEGAVVLLGPSAALERYGVDASALKFDNYMIRSGGNFLAIVGRDSDAPPGGSFYTRTLMGTLNGVYRFFEDQCGVRIYMAHEKGIVATKTTTLRIPGDLDVRYQKSVLWGGPGFKHSGDVNMRWRWRGMPGLDIKSHGGHGWTDSIVPSAKYGAEHPEYFPLVDGKRRPDLGGKNQGLCTTHPEVRQIFLDYTKSVFDTGFDVMELGAPDWGTGAGVTCECKVCGDRSTYEKQWQAFGGLPPYLNEVHVYHDARIWELHLWLANKLLKTHPDRKLMLIAYGNTWRALPGMSKKSFPKNVVIELSADMGPLESDYPADRIKPGGKLSPGARLGWGKLGVPIFGVYNYFWMPYFADGPGPKCSISQIVYSFKRYKELGVGTLYYCGRPSNWGLEGVQYYLDHRLRMNIDADVEAILNEYFIKFYGPAADTMRAFFDHIEEVQNSTGWKIHETGWIRYGEDVMEIYTKRWTKARVDKALALLAKAEAAVGEGAEADPVYSARVSLSRPSMEWVAHTAEVCRLERVNQAEKTEPSEKAWEDAVNRRDTFIDAYATKVESGYWRDLGLPAPMSGTNMKFDIRDELRGNTWGVFRGPFQVK